jgi:hypothetical protein
VVETFASFGGGGDGGGDGGGGTFGKLQDKRAKLASVHTTVHGVDVKDA